MIERGTYERFVDRSPWVMQRIKERDTVVDRTLREPFIDFGKDVMKGLRDRQSNVDVVSQQLRANIFQRLRERV